MIKKSFSMFLFGASLALSLPIRATALPCEILQADTTTVCEDLYNFPPGTTCCWPDGNCEEWNDDMYLYAKTCQSGCINKYAWLCGSSFAAVDGAPPAVCAARSLAATDMVSAADAP
ncbi:MAG: hypothetical protein ABUT39_12080 [Acidobacteriota bacterium]